MNFQYRLIEVTFMKSRRIGYFLLLYLVLGWTFLATYQTPYIHAANNVPAPFLYRPYYGNASVISRSVSLFDHDDPTYHQDGKFVRYDGQTFTSKPGSGCTPYVDCYDGHNGYDINMFFEPVLSAGAGKVIRAGWFNPANHSDNGGLWVAIDHGNGYTTMYCHLSAILVQVGQTVGVQWQIGTSGTTGASTGPHLHFTAFQMPNWLPMDPFGWQGSQADPSPTPSYYLWTANPQSSSQVPCLGCDNGTPHAGATVMKAKEAGFSSTGNWQAAYAQKTIGSQMYWTSTSTGSATATATWQPNLTTPGLYEIGVYVDLANASSQWIPYTVTSLTNSGTATTTVWLDQFHIGSFQGPYGPVNTGAQWVGLGTYQLGPGSKVMVSNATGEQGEQIGIDAIEFVPVSGGVTGGSGQPAATPTATPLPPTPTPPSLTAPRKRGR
jgi:Peptidase family M23